MARESASTALWLHEQPLVLASGSKTRRELLLNAGIPLLVMGSDIDERAVEAALPGADAASVAQALAAAKALDVAARVPGRLVLGADQTLALDGHPIHKPADGEAARAQLKRLQGRRHHLVSAFALVQDGEVLQAGARTAVMAMRPLSDAMIDRYLATAGPTVAASVGAYQLEGLGVHLMEQVEGDHFTVLGLPMMDVLACLRQLGAVAG